MPFFRWLDIADEERVISPGEFAYVPSNVEHSPVLIPAYPSILIGVKNE